MFVFRFNICLVGALICTHSVLAQQFVDATDAANLTLTHQTVQNIVDIADVDDNLVTPLPLEDVRNNAQLLSSWLTAGVAAGDYDADGWPDLFVIGGDLGTNKLFRNLGDGTFEDKTEVSGLNGLTGFVAGAVFADVDGDGDLDLFVGGALGQTPRLLIQEQVDGEPVFLNRFSTAFTGFDEASAPNTWGASFADINGDQCLDAFFPHSLTPPGPEPSLKTAAGSSQHLWLNHCRPSAATFQDISVSSGIAAIFDDDFPNGGRDQTFAGIFTDINDDHQIDILISGDIGTSLVLLNRGNNQYDDVTDRDVIDDRNGMGTDVGDVNLDGRMDWFTSNISNLGGSAFGNRLYLGDADDDSGFLNVTQSSGVLEGLWGWGSCIVDADLDRFPDIFHVNGFYFANNTNQNSPDGRFDNKPAVMFMSNGDGTFSESAQALGIGDTGEGRGVVCFDYDQDGDMDIAISNYKGAFKLYRNDLPVEQRRYLAVKLNGSTANTEAIGAIVRVSSENPNDSDEQLTQLIKAGSHFVSASPAVAHFGLGDWLGPLQVTVVWPSGSEDQFGGISINQRLVLDQAEDQILQTGFETEE